MGKSLAAALGGLLVTAPAFAQDGKPITLESAMQIAFQMGATTQSQVMAKVGELNQEIARLKGELSKCSPTPEAK
ncbi:MAG TPA: hypothetical protein VJQ25_10950 [Nitrospira sp.]|nr:hypothetical protein [Nitrospira sp.]